MNNSKRILIVDDSNATLSHYKFLLKDLCADIDCASNGSDGLNMAIAKPYDLIITDVHMPQMTGIEMCRALQNSESTRTIPVIIVSDFDSEPDVEIGFKAGAAAYLGKKEVNKALQKTVTDLLWKYDNVRQKHILIVDDSQPIVDFIEDGLKEHAYKVTTASDGLYAQKIVASVNPDLILCDLKMPGLDGYGFCKWLKSNPLLAQIPFVAMSSGDERYAIQRIIQYGAASYLQKPFSISQLIVLLDRILSDYFKILNQERERLNNERLTLVNSISSLVTALEARDIYTKGHSESVAVMLSEMLKLTGAEIEDVELITVGGRLHDIGKIGIRDNVLLKPGPLTDEEFTHIKEHPIIGKKILGPIASLEKILPIAYSHHEHWNGRGYPEGLAGTEIPLWARMTSVADTFDALISDRPYRSGLPIEKAFKIIKEVRGTQLCPECVDLFFAYAATQAFNDRFHKSQ